MKWYTRSRVWVPALLAFVLIATLHAQEAQMINRAVNITQGNLTVSRGYTYSGGALMRDYRPVNTVTDTAAHTFTATEILTGYILRTGLTANRTDVLPTAANLIAAMPGAITGQTVMTVVDMGATPGAAATINGASTGVTYGTSCATAIDTSDATLLLINITSATTYRMTCLNANN